MKRLIIILALGLLSCTKTPRFYKVAVVEEYGYYDFYDRTKTNQFKIKIYREKSGKYSHPIKEFGIDFTKATSNRVDSLHREADKWMIKAEILENSK